MRRQRSGWSNILFELRKTICTGATHKYFLTAATGASAASARATTRALAGAAASARATTRALAGAAASACATTCAPAGAAASASAKASATAASAIVSSLSHAARRPSPNSTRYCITPTDQTKEVASVAYHFGKFRGSCRDCRIDDSDLRQGKCAGNYK